MKKQLISRGLLGFPLGISIGYVITIILSLFSGKGTYIFCATELIEATGSQVNAVTVQAMLCGILGATFGVCSTIWEIDNWSIAKQTSIYFLITSMVMMPIAYFANWMPRTFAGFFIYFGIFAAIFLFIWILQYLLWKSKIDQINAKIAKN